MKIVYKKSLIIYRKSLQNCTTISFITGIKRTIIIVIIVYILFAFEN